MEFGEDLIEAAKRELNEELGIKDAQLKFFSITEGKKDENQHYIQVNFLMESFDGRYKLMEPDFCEEWNFFSLDDLPEVFPPHINIITSYLENKNYIN